VSPFGLAALVDVVAKIGTKMTPSKVSPQSNAECDTRPRAVMYATTNAQRTRRKHKGTVSVEEAATLLGISCRTAYRRAGSGQMPDRVRNGLRMQWRLVDIQKMAKPEGAADGEVL
jgi:hypothetical protein